MGTTSSLTHIITVTHSLSSRPRVLAKSVETYVQSVVLRPTNILIYTQLFSLLRTNNSQQQAEIQPAVKHLQYFRRAGDMSRTKAVAQCEMNEMQARRRRRPREAARLLC